VKPTIRHPLSPRHRQSAPHRHRPKKHEQGQCVTPRSEKEGTTPPYVCPGCSNHTYDQQYGEQIQYLVKLQTRIFTK
jgi:hypothetical protein